MSERITEAEALELERLWPMGTDFAATAALNALPKLLAERRELREVLARCQAYLDGTPGGNALYIRIDALLGEPAPGAKGEA